MSRFPPFVLTVLAFLANSTIRAEEPASTQTPATSQSDHWAYRVPQRVTLPSVQHPDWCRNEIDRFVSSRIEKTGLTPSPSATKEKLLRRLSFDLTGLPPTIDELDTFLADESPDAFEQAVDRLLASPAYGERWATPWLDAARYADSNGFQRDGHRIAWPFRDWVIRAINRDMPFDQFTVEQLAGDMLPNATLDQKIATGFHRGTTVNLEAGTDQEENRVNQIFDRVNVTGTVWLGTTLECCQCHDHKYDPFRQSEYYSLFAVFNSTEIETREQSKGSAARDFSGPMLELPETAELLAQRRSVSRRMQELNAARERHEQNKLDEFAAWQREMSEKAASRKPLPDLPVAMMRILKTADKQRTKKQQDSLFEYFFERDAEWKSIQSEIDEVKRQLDTLKPVSALVMSELSQPRKTRLLKRGNFETPGDDVSPNTPSELPAWSDDLPRNRLGFARWLASANNPLVARVTVNRWWSEFFGSGLHATPEDFGVMSEEPLHRNLLDWLAVEFVESGWSMKHVHRLIVTSATYRQSGEWKTSELQADPENKLLARGPRQRLPAEFIRDHTLVTAGLLARRIGGPPVYPPQPENIWRVTGAVDNKYRTSVGADRYRRGVYTVWRRSSPYPSFVNFDAPDRAACVVKRTRTNTPLQALTLLNDPVFVEAATCLAERIQSGDIANGIDLGFRLCVSRPPTQNELVTLAALFQAEQQRLESDAEKTMTSESATQSAWRSVASVLLNLDEAITK